MKNISSPMLKAVLTLFYANSTEVPHNLVSEFRSAMQSLEVDNFAYECDMELMRAITDAMMVPSTNPKNPFYWDDNDKDEAFEEFPQVGLGMSYMIHIPYGIEQYSSISINIYLLNPFQSFTRTTTNCIGIAMVRIVRCDA